MRIKFVVAYDGTDFRGWARSPGHRTVHDVLRSAIERVVGHEIELTGASRTDSGAHARGQVCHFDTEVPIETSKWPTVTNRVLPGDVAVVHAKHVGDDFHARFCAEDRSYEYRIRLSERRDPFAGRYAHEYGKPLDISRMREAAQFLVGEHNFRAFTEELDPSVENTVRKLRKVEVILAEEDPYFHGPEIWIQIVGTAFLRGMMRRISGCLLEVGAGKRPVQDVSRLLESKGEGMHLPVVLPAKGLTLMRIRYGNPPRDCRLGIPDHSAAE